MRNLNQHQQTLQQALAGLSDEQRSALAALTQRLQGQPDRPSRADSDEELMRKAHTIFQQLSPAEQALLAKLGQGFQSVLAASPNPAVPDLSSTPTATATPPTLGEPDGTAPQPTESNQDLPS